jgi:hypothetical protein
MPYIKQDARTEYCRAYKAKARAAILKLYGDACVRCGFSDSRALQIDHIKPEHVKNTPSTPYRRGSTGLYLAILTGLVPKEDYQCLCANCNWIKRYESPAEGTARHRRTVVIFRPIMPE